MQGAVRAVQRNQERQKMMEFFMQRLDEKAFQKIFRESMDDVKAAIQAAQFDPKAPDVISASSITKADSLQELGNFQVYYNGKKIELTLIDPSMITSLTRPSTYLKTPAGPFSVVKDATIAMAQIKRNLITTYHPEFNVKALVKEAFGYAYTADQELIGGANKYKFWKSFTILREFRKDPEFYKMLKENVSPGVLARDYQNVKGDDLVKKVASSANMNANRSTWQKVKAMAGENKVVTSLTELAQYSDMAARGRYYKDVYAALVKRGQSHEEAQANALAAARDLAVNYQERGANEFFNNYKAMVPFLKTTINSMTKDLLAVQHKPQQVAEVLTVMTGLSYGLLQHNLQFVDENGEPIHNKVPQYIRLNAWTIRTGYDVNDYYIVPSPFSFAGKLPIIAAEGLDTIFTSVANRIAEDHYKGVQELSKAAAGSKLSVGDWALMSANALIGQVNPYSALPPPLTTGLELLTNRSGTGGVILPEHLQKVDAQQQYIPGQTSKLAIELGQLTGGSPIMIQYGIESNLGELGKGIFSGGDMILSALAGKERPQMELRSVPFVDVFSGHGSEADKTDATQMYSKLGTVLRKVNSTANTLKTRMEDGTGSKEAYLDYIEENRELIRAYKGIIEPTNKKVSALYKRIGQLQSGGFESERTPDKEVLGDPKLREKITDLRNQITDARTKALKQLERNKEKYGDLWTKRLQLAPLVEDLVSPFLDMTPEKAPIDKPVDKNDKTSYNFWDNFSLISSAQAADKPPQDTRKVSKGLEEDTTKGLKPMLEMPPAIIQEAPKQQEDKIKFNFPGLDVKAKQSKKTKTAAPASSYFTRLASVESSNNPNAKAKTSSATGLFQFTKGTWAEVVKKFGKEHGFTEKDILNPKKQKKAIKLFTEDNKARLAKSLEVHPRVIDDTALYAAHFLGVSGATKLLTSPYTANAVKLFPEAAAANKPIFYDSKGRPKTVKEVIQVIEKKIKNG